MRVNPIPAVFSFLLPGLGQVFQRRLAPAVLFFAGFTALSFLRYGRWLLPIVALGAAVETFLQEQKAPTSSEGGPRRTLFTVVGMLGFFGWMSWVSPVFLPVGDLLETQGQADDMAKAIRRCRNDLGRLPGQLSECAGTGLFVQDNWGETFQYRADARGFEIRSSGRDRQLGNGDDFVFHYRE